MLLAFTSYGQVKKYTVQGQILDDANLPIIGATVVFLSPADSVMQAFGITDKDGKYSIKNVKEGEVIAQVTYLGYGTFEKRMAISSETNIVDLGVTTLDDNVTVLAGVEIKASFTPIIIKKDTVEYNADAFKVRPNGTVEDLLKKLPGVEVDTDGTITAQGEQVNKVTVDGKKFFGDDPKMATQNLPANAVKKVQIIDKKSDRSEFSGISDGQSEKIINLELKPDKKIGLFGDVKAGYGTNDRFDTKIGINKFNSKYQLSTIINYNNINQQGFSFNDYSSLTGGPKPDRNGNVMFTGGSAPINFGDTGDGDTRSATGGLNFSFDLAKKSRFTTSYFLTYVDKFISQVSTVENFLPGRSFIENSTTTTDSKSVAHNANLDLELNPDSMYRINLNGSVRLNNSDQFSDQIKASFNEANIRTNDIAQKNDGHAKRNDISFKAEINRKMNKPGRLVTLTGNYGNSNTDDDAFLDRDGTQGQGEIIDVLQNQLSFQDNNNYLANLLYTEPLGNQNYLNASFKRSNYNYNKIKDFYNLNPDDLTIQEFDSLLSNVSSNAVNYNNFTFGYTRDRESYNLNADVQYQISTLRSSATSQLDINRNFYYILPSVSFNWVDKKIRFSYNTNISEPSATQLQPTIDNSNPTRLYKGNPDLKPKYSHNLNLRYNFFDNFNFKSLFAFLSYNYTKNDIVTALTFDENSIGTSVPVNVDNRQSINGSINFNTPIRPLKIKSGIRLNNNYSKGITFINDVQNTVNTNTPSLRLELENIDNEVVSLMVFGRLRYSQNTYSDNLDQNTSYLTKEFGSTLIVNFGKGFILDSDLRYYIYSQEQFAEDNKYTLLNASLSKNLFNDRLTAKVNVFDILDQNRGISRNISDTSVSEVISNSLQRYGMLSLTYKLSSFSPNKNNGMMIMRH